MVLLGYLINKVWGRIKETADKKSKARFMLLKFQQAVKKYLEKVQSLRVCKPELQKKLLQSIVLSSMILP